jgi:hypothetical protein
VSPSTAQNWDVYDYGPVFVEEEFPLTPFHPMEDPMMAPLVNSHNPLVPPVQGDENSPERKLEEYCGCLVLEEMAPVSVEEEAPGKCGLNYRGYTDQDVVPAMIPQQSFSTENCNSYLIFVGTSQTSFTTRKSSIVDWICSSTLFQASLKKEDAQLVVIHSLFLQFRLTLRQLMVIKVLLVFDILHVYLYFATY